MEGFEVAESSDYLEQITDSWGGALTCVVLYFLDHFVTDSSDVVEITDNALVLSLVSGCGVK